MFLERRMQKRKCLKRTAKNTELRQRKENSGMVGGEASQGHGVKLRMKDDLDLKILVGDPRTRIELSMEDTLDFRAFGSTPKYSI